MNKLFLSATVLLSTMSAYASPGTDHAHGPEGGTTSVIVIVGVIIVGFVLYSVFSKKKK